MILDILYNLELLFQDFFSAFGLFTILFFITSLFVKKQILYKIDEESIKFISLIGILYIIILATGIIIELSILNEEDKIALLNRMFGKYWFGFYLQPLLWVFITQVLRVKKINKNVLLRLLFSFFLMISIEKIIIIITSFHRDYLPSSWTMYNESGFYPSNLLLAFLIKMIVFLLAIAVFSQLRKKILILKSD